MGYYEVPARTSLTRLARVVGISKAAMSKILRRAEGRVLRSLIHG
jgi:predicted DNA binding protein